MILIWSTFNPITCGARRCTLRMPIRRISSQLTPGGKMKVGERGRVLATLVECVGKNWIWVLFSSLTNEWRSTSSWSVLVAGKKKKKNLDLIEASRLLWHLRIYRMTYAIEQADQNRNPNVLTFNCHRRVTGLAIQKPSSRSAHQHADSPPTASPRLSLPFSPTAHLVSAGGAAQALTTWSIISNKDGVPSMIAKWLGRR